MKFMISFGMLIAWLFPIILSFTLYVLSLMLLKLFMLFMSAGWIICSLQFLQDTALNSKPFLFIRDFSILLLQYLHNIVLSNISVMVYLLCIYGKRYTI